MLAFLHQITRLGKLEIDRYPFTHGGVMNLKLDRHWPTANPNTKNILENSSAANRKIIHPLNDAIGMVNR